MRAARWLAEANRSSWISQGDSYLVLGRSCVCCKVSTRPATKVRTEALARWWDDVCEHTQLRIENSWRYGFFVVPITSSILFDVFGAGFCPILEEHGAPRFLGNAAWCVHCCKVSD